LRPDSPDRQAGDELGKLRHQIKRQSALFRCPHVAVLAVKPRYPRVLLRTVQTGFRTTVELDDPVHPSLVQLPGAAGRFE